MIGRDGESERESEKYVLSVRLAAAADIYKRTDFLRPLCQLMAAVKYADCTTVKR